MMSPALENMLRMKRSRNDASWYRSERDSSSENLCHPLRPPRTNEWDKLRLRCYFPGLQLTDEGPRKQSRAYGDAEIHFAATLVSSLTANIKLEITRKSLLSLFSNTIMKINWIKSSSTGVRLPSRYSHPRPRRNGGRSVMGSTDYAERIIIIIDPTSAAPAYIEQASRRDPGSGNADVFFIMATSVSSHLIRRALRGVDVRYIYL